MKMIAKSIMASPMHRLVLSSNLFLHQAELSDTCCFQRIMEKTVSGTICQPINASKDVAEPQMDEGLFGRFIQPA